MRTMEEELLREELDDKVLHIKVWDISPSEEEGFLDVNFELIELSQNHTIQVPTKG